MKDELRAKLRSAVWSYAYDKGVRLRFMHDSKDINEGIETIISRTVFLIENTKLDHLLLESMKGAKDMNNAVEEKKPIKTMFKGWK